ncbi:HEPN domain-containing protein [Haloarcula mannanilytica]|uniref:HEPN domain-containing protein n=1 Tax=Haloarcula mannanilytica TaxID=2509225 RepID=UPI0010F7352B|nr:HEPN domain-containing protein [Haloarcula mannanilytica]
MNSNLDLWVEEAVDCFETDGSLSGQNISKFNKLLQLIVEEWSIDNDLFRVSDKTISRKAREVLRKARRYKNPVQYFHNSKGDVQKSLHSEPHLKYTIVFPLNIKFTAMGDRPDSFTIQEENLIRIANSTWKTQYWPSIKNKRNIKRVLEKSPNSINSNNFSYWKYQVEAVDQRYAMNRISELVELLCAKINFSLHQGRAPDFHASTGPWPYRWSQLRPPFIYFVFKEGIHLGYYKREKYNSYFYSTDPEPRKTVRVSSNKQERYVFGMEYLPDIPRELDDVDQVLVDGLYLYQSGIAESDQQDAFLNYWRGIENMTLTNEQERMTEIPSRTASLFEPENKEIFKYRLQRVRLIRNNLVHEGRQTKVEDDDLKLLKTVLEALIMLFVEFRQKWDITDFEFVLNTGRNDETKLKEMKNSRHREIYLIQQMLNDK